MRILVKEIVNKVGEEVLLKGWVSSRRDHGQLIFIDLRDVSGTAQIVFSPVDKELLTKADKLRPEWVIALEGRVKERPKGMVNQDLETGKIEIEALRLEILNESKTPPFPVDNDGREVGEEHRLTYRYLDLRRPRMQKNMRLRHEIILFSRNYLSERGFVEIETPILTKGTPEGAREFVVPSRLYPGNFYVLPQSPQQFKQLLMVAGFEKYFQIARVFRDEDLRGDRQPEFTQLDVEMSFVSREDVLQISEEVISALVSELFPDKKISASGWPRLTYAEAIEKYGSDKPDLRYDKNDANELAFCHVIDFPMFEKGADGNIQAMHHPFTSPLPEDMDQLDSRPMSVRADSYDIVLNGYEISSGSIRIHKCDLQNKIFKILGLSDEEIQKRFGHMLTAFEYGAPPHGGFAPGVDRLVMILAGEPNISEVIAFPKTGTARDLLMGAPAEISKKQLDELAINVKKDV